MLKRALMATAITFGAASAQAGNLLTEGFDDVAALAKNGWTQQNLSTPIGTTDWYQGDASIFGAQSGAAESYVAANYNSAAAGGDINNALVSSIFSTQHDGSVSFWARSAGDPSFVDTLSYSFVSASGASLGALGGAVITLTDTWTQYTLNFAAQGESSIGRLAFNYFGKADTSNYIGIDNISIDTVAPVPEPASWALMSLGLAGVGVFARRRQKNHKA